jgi:hypothetical protein
MQTFVLRPKLKMDMPMAQKNKQLETGVERRSAAKRDRSWSLLMVGDHGQIIPFRRIKGIAMMLIAVATLAVSAAVGLGFWSGWLRVRNAGLRSELETSREAVRKLRDEKDLLMAKVVILEARAQKSDTASTSAKAASTPEEPTTVGGAGEVDVSPADAQKQASPPASAKKQAAEVTPEKQAAVATAAASAAVPKVAVSAFVADHNPRRHTLSASFQIKNIGAGGQKVSGHCVLVMKNTIASDMKWVSVPSVSLLNGRPNGKQGRAFRIAHFMNLKMETHEVPADFAFDSGTLYVFDDDGQQILEKEVTIQLSYRKLEPEPESQPEPKPERQPDAAPASPPRAASQPDSQTDTAPAPEGASPSFEKNPEAVEPTPEPTPSEGAPPAAETPTESRTDSPAATSPTTTEGGNPATTPGSKQGVDPSLLPNSNAAPVPATPATGVEDTR